MTCKHFKPDHSTELDGWGKCMQIESFKARGATHDMCEQVIHEKLNGGLKSGLNNYIFEKACCDESRGCTKYENE